MCWSLFLILGIAKFLRAPILKNICKLLLLKMCSWNWEKLKFIYKEFKFYIRKQVFSTSVLQTSSWLIFLDWFPMKFVFTYNISLVCREINSKQKKIKSSRKEYVMWTCFKFWPMWKHFPKTANQWEFDYGLFTSLSIIIVARDFCPSSFKLRRGILPLLTKYVS